MKSESQKIAEFLVEFFAQKGISLTTFLKKAHISAGTISNWRKNKSKVTNDMRLRMVTLYPVLQEVLLEDQGEGVALFVRSQDWLNHTPQKVQEKPVESNGTNHHPSFGAMIEFLAFARKEKELINVLIHIDEWAVEHDMTLTEVLQKLNV